MHWVKKGADGTVLGDWYHVQHFDQNHDVLGQVGYDVESNELITKDGDKFKLERIN